MCPDISNLDFLKAIVTPSRNKGISRKHGKVWVCPRSQTNSNWTGKDYTGKDDIINNKKDNYFCISLVQEVDGTVARKKKNFCALMCVVLDDIGTKSKAPPLKPSWKLETSPNNEQWGYILSTPITSISEADELFNKLARSGYTDPGAKAPSTRYMRLPVGVNSKKEHLENNNGEPIPVALNSWNPELTYSVQEIEEGFQLEAAPSKAEGPNIPLSAEANDNAENIRLILNGENYHDAMLRLSASYISKGLGLKDTTEAMQGIMLSNAAQQDNRWQERFQDIPRLVQGAYEKYAKGDNSTNFNIISAKEFMDVSPPLWAVKNLLPQLGIAMVFGKSGAGKSFFTLDLMLAIARGAVWCGLKTKPLKVVYVVAEGVSGFRNRLAAYAIAHGVDMENVPILIIPQAPNLRVDDDKAIINAIEEQGGADIVVIDTLAQASAGANENSAEDMGAVLKRCQNIQTAIQGLVILVHHTGKDESKGARGWSGLKAAMDTEIEVSASVNGDIKTMQAKVTKQKDGEEGKTFPFRLCQTVLGQDEDGENITSCVVEFDDFYRKLPKPGGKWQKRAILSVKALQDEYAGSVPIKALVKHMLETELTEQDGTKQGKRDSRWDSAERAVERVIEMGWLSEDDDGTVSLVRNVSQNSFCEDAT